MKRNLLFVSLAFVGMIVGFASCTSNDDTTIVYPGSENYFKTLEELVGVDSVQDPSTGMFVPVFKALTSNVFTDYDKNIGIFPPNIEGSFKMPTNVLKYSTDPADQVVIDINQGTRSFAFKNQHNRIASYSASKGGSSDEVDTIYIMGQENKFATWFVSRNKANYQQYNWDNVLVCIYTGELTTDAAGNRGIKNLKYGFYIREMVFGYVLSHADSVNLSAVNAVGTLKFYEDETNFTPEVIE